MKILFLSFYFEPDLCAGSFRNTALLKELIRQVPAGSEIDVITTLPSRYASFSVEAKAIEQFDSATVHRVALPSHKSGMFDQSKAYISYARSTIKLIKFKQYDLIYTSSSRLMTACLGAYISRKQQAPLYLDIRDIFVDTIKDVLSKKLAWVIKPVFSMLEKWTFNQATKINLVSEGFKAYFQQRYPTVPLSFFTNGIDDEFLELPVSSDVAGKLDIPEVLYAGNIGHGQGLHTVIPPLAKQFEGKLKFKVIGDGGCKSQFEQALKANAVSNVELLPPAARVDLIQAYQHSDILFMHLNDYDAFHKVLPSKVFEYAALGKPIWAGVSGFAASFINDNIMNAAIFNPCNVEQAVSVFHTLKLQYQPRDAFVKKFSRANIMKEMAADVINLQAAVK